MAQENKTEKESPSDVKALIQSDVYRKQFAMAMPKHMKPERFIRIAITAMTKNPKLAKCTQASLVSCLLDLSALGLEPDGRRAHLIPFMNNKTGEIICTLLIDYKGLVELAMNTKEVSNIHADVICEEDTFVYNLGQVEKHEIDFRRDRGKMYAVYCIITMKDGTKKCEVMTKAEVDAIRKRSKSANDGPWVTDYNEMSKKTVFRRASKWIKLSPEVREKLEKDDGQFETVPSAPGAPVIELKNDKNKKPTDQAGEVVDAEIEGPDAWKNVGDTARFGEANATKAKTLAQNITKCAEKLGKEKFMAIVGNQGVERMTEILKIEDLVKLTNELLDAVRDLE